MLTSFLFTFVALFAADSSDQPAVFQQFAKPMTFYYESPDPTLGPKYLKELLKKENIEHPWFKDKGYVLQLIGAQLGDIAIGKPKIVRAYEAEFAGAPLAGRRVIVRALMNCGDGETLKQVTAWLGDKNIGEIKPELTSLKKHLEDPARKQVRDRPARDPDDLDLLWSNFSITGEYAPVSRILDVFDLPDAKENETLKRVAKWSLGSNLQQHPKLAAIVLKHAKDRPEGSRKVIDQLIVFPSGDTKPVP